MTDLTGWDARMVKLADGLDLTSPADQRELTVRILVRADANTTTLRALAAWLDQPCDTTRRRVIAHRVALGWAHAVEHRRQAAVDTEDTRQEPR